MTDFAKYAFNKSHAAAYAVVSYQTAWLKYYYPVEFMAALMTSVIDNSAKVSEYILNCRQMGIGILPPDINLGEGNFSVDGNNIRYGLSAIKSIGRPVIDAIVQERKRGGIYKSLTDFIERASGKEINKRTIESLIKAGALDGLGATRKQMMEVYAGIMEHTAMEKKSAITGQMSLFDLLGEEEKREYELKMPDVGEFEKEQLLAFEKEVLGIYISGHPLQKYEKLWQRGISNVSSDFALDEETNQSRVQDNSKAIIGGMITEKTVKYTKTNKTMAFLTVEDLVGTVEVVVFPRDYEKNSQLLTQDRKVFVQGRVSCEDDKPSKLICEKMWAFEEMPEPVRELWVQFADKQEYQAREKELFDVLRHCDGRDRVAIYVRSERAVRRLGENWGVCADEALITQLSELFGADNVRVK
jgi:DNA polymerase-3 subunit alpha